MGSDSDSEGGTDEESEPAAVTASTLIQIGPKGPVTPVDQNNVLAPRGYVAPPPPAAVTAVAEARAAAKAAAKTLPLPMPPVAAGGFVAPPVMTTQVPAMPSMTVMPPMIPTPNPMPPVLWESAPVNVPAAAQFGATQFMSPAALGSAPPNSYFPPVNMKPWLPGGQESSVPADAGWTGGVGGGGVFAPPKMQTPDLVRSVQGRASPAVGVSNRASPAMVNRAPPKRRVIIRKTSPAKAKAKKTLKLKSQPASYADPGFGANFEIEDDGNGNDDVEYVFESDDSPETPAPAEKKWYQGWKGILAAVGGVVALALLVWAVWWYVHREKRLTLVMPAASSVVLPPSASVSG